MKCDTPPSRSSSRREPPANIKTTLVEWRSGIDSTTRRAPPGNACTRWGAPMGSESIGALVRGALAQCAQRGIQGHGDEIRRHPVRNGVQRLAQVAADVGHLVDLADLEAVADRLGNLGRGDLFVACLVSDRVDQRDRLPDPLRGGPAGHGSSVGRRYCSGSLRGPTTTRRSGSSPMLELVTSGSPARASLMAPRSNGCIASSVIASPVILT